MEKAQSNPYKNKPCNYKSYGDYCDPITCWCSKSLQWEREQGMVSVVDIMKQLQHINNVKTEEYIKQNEQDGTTE
jgi:hypothetical protein